MDVVGVRGHLPPCPPGAGSSSAPRAARGDHEPDTDGLGVVGPSGRVEERAPEKLSQSALAGVIVFPVCLWISNPALLLGLEFDAGVSRR